MSFVLKYSTLLICFNLFISISVFSQENPNSSNYVADNDIKPLRIGIKGGFPNLGTINLEYVTPLLSDRVAIYTDYLSLSPTIDGVEFDYSNFEIGSNIYLRDTGNGLYVGVGMFSFDSKINQDGEEGTLEFNTINLKLGVKTGGAVYFRLELGYGFGDIPDFIELTDTSTGETTREDISDINSLFGSGIPIFNLGIGFAFL